MVPKVGIEPKHLAVLDFESAASTYMSLIMLDIRYSNFILCN